MRLYDEKRKPFNFNHIIIFTDITNKNIKIKIEVLNIHIFLSFYELNYTVILIKYFLGMMKMNYLTLWIWNNIIQKKI